MKKQTFFKKTRLLILVLILTSNAIGVFAWLKVIFQIGKLPIPSEPDIESVGWSDALINFIEKSLVMGAFSVVGLAIIMVLSIFFQSARILKKQLVFELIAVGFYLFLVFGNFGRWWVD